jgi:O-antigen ligase
MSSLMRRLAMPAGGLRLRRLGFEERQPAPLAAVIDAAPAWIERLFLVFAFVVLQDAFLDMASSASGSTNVSDTGDNHHVIAFLCVLFGTAVFARKHLPEMIRTARASPIYFILPAILLISAVWSLEPLLTLKRSLVTIGICIFDLYIATAIGLDRLLKLLAATILISALASIVTAIALPTVGREVFTDLAGDWRGVFPQKNLLGYIMTIGLFVEMALIIRTRRLRIGNCLRAVVYLFLLGMAHSASSLLLVMIAAILSVFYVAYRRGLQSLLICVALGLSAIAIFGGIIATDPTFVFAALDRDPSLTGRTEIWDYVLDAIHERPLFGWGYMAFWSENSPGALYIQNQLQWPAPNAHNGYLDLALDLGLVGLAGMAVTALWTLRRVAVLILSRNDLGALLLIFWMQLVIGNLSESFVINASIFGWNIFSIFVLKAGIVLRQIPAAEEVAPVSVLKRAKVV